jgi:exosortase A-associated hydrolase 2
MAASTLGCSSGMEQAFFFDVDGSRLFGIAHRPTHGGARVGVVMCHPYGEEKQFSYPVFVWCARALTAGGWPVLRFDCRGYGDSDGELEGATVASHVADTIAAGRLARERLGVPAVVYLGLRFGAAIAALAAEHDSTTAGLILWDPIVDGSQYVGEIIRKRVFAEILAGRRASAEELQAQLAKDGELEIEGNGLTQGMVADLAVIDLRTTLARLGCPVLATAIQPPGRASAKPSALGAGCERAGTQPFWERPAMYDQYHPEDLLELTCRWLRERWPAA